MALTKSITPLIPQGPKPPSERCTQFKTNTMMFSTKRRTGTDKHYNIQTYRNHLDYNKPKPLGHF